MTTLLLSREEKLLSQEEESAPKSSYLSMFEEVEEDISFVEEPPAWHEAVLKEREKEWEQRETMSRSFEEVFKDLRAQSRGN